MQRRRRSFFAQKTIADWNCNCLPNRYSILELSSCVMGQSPSVDGRGPAVDGWMDGGDQTSHLSLILFDVLIVLGKTGERRWINGWVLRFLLDNLMAE